MSERDFAAELHAIEKQLASARDEQSRLQGEKNGLSRERAEIVTTCRQLDVEPKREAIDTEIAKVESAIASELSAIDAELKKVST
jgi:chromosome segregation ATPase